MRLSPLVVAISLVAPLAHGQGILKRYGADGSISQRFGGAESQQETVIINGQTYRVQRNPGAGSRIGVDPQSGRVYPDVGSGAVNPSTGQFYPRAGGGYVDPATGRFIPGQ